MATPTFLGIPAELRLVTYDYYLAEHQRVRQNIQPSNEHIRLLRTCRQINYEASPLFCKYISLRHERQINAFILRAGTSSYATRVLWADVANDGRVISSRRRPNAHARRETPESPDSPLSNLHIALRLMTNVTRLRVFQCRQGLPVDLQRLNVGRLNIRFELAMFPSGTNLQLSTYELHLDAQSRVLPFEILSPQYVKTLRLTGDCELPVTPDIETPALRHLTIYAVTGKNLDKRSMDKCFPGAVLESFSYGLGHRLGFELRDRHLQSLVALSGSALRRLTLLGCTRLSSTAIAKCLEGLPNLECLALSIVTVDECRTNFVPSVPHSVQVFKFHITNAWYAVPLLVEEGGLCDAIEETLLSRYNPPREVWIHIRDKLLRDESRIDRWQDLTHRRRITLCIGPWENRCSEEL